MNMKSFVWILMLMLVWTGCQKIEKFTQFKIVYHSEAVIPATVNINVPYDIPLPPVTTDTEQTFENNNTHKDLIEKIVLEQLNAKIIDPANGDFSFLSSIEIYISTAEMPEKKIAWSYHIPDNAGSELELDTTDDDLQAYLKADKFKLRVRVTTDELITNDYRLDIKTVFFVDAKILGV
jgi:hypothetical protein